MTTQTNTGSIRCTAEITQANLLGRMTVDGGYIESDFIRLVQSGGTFTFEDAQAMNPETFAIVERVRRYAFIYVCMRGRDVWVHPDFVMRFTVPQNMDVPCSLDVRS